MTRTAKSNLLPLLEGAIPPVEQPSSDAVNIVDGMAMQQAFKGSPATFGELAELLRRLLLDSMQQAKSTLCSTQCYRDSFIIRTSSAAGVLGPGADVLRLTIAGRSTKCPKQWSKALHVSGNKAAVVTFLVDEWQRVTMPFPVRHLW